MVLVVMGVLAVFATPLFTTNDFNARGFHDETLALLRFAQKTAIAQRRTVCVALNATGISLKIYAANPAVGSCNSAPSMSLPNTPRGGSGLAGSVASFLFTPLGSTDQSANVTITIANSSSITVEAATGCIHE